MLQRKSEKSPKIWIKKIIKHKRTISKQPFLCSELRKHKLAALISFPCSKIYQKIKIRLNK